MIRHLNPHKNQLNNVNYFEYNEKPLCSTYYYIGGIM